MCGLSLAVWSRDDNLWSVFSCMEQEMEMCGLSLAVWSRDDNLWSVFSCLEQSWQAAYGPTIPSVVKPACVLLPSVRLTIVGSPQDSAPCAAHHHGFPTGQSLTEAQQEAREGTTPTYATSSMTSQLGTTYATSSGHHNRVKPPLTPHRRACGGAWHCPLACFVAWHHHHCPLVSPPFWDGPGVSSHTEK